MKVSGAPRGLYFQASLDADERMNRCSFVLALIGAVVLASPALGTGIQSDEVEMSPISGTDRVEYCIGCHLATQDTDHLYFIPEAVRVRPSAQRQ